MGETRGNQEEDCINYSCSVNGTGTKEDKWTWTVTVGLTVLYGIHILTFTMYVLFLISYCKYYELRSWLVLILQYDVAWTVYVLFFLINFLSNCLTSHVKCGCFCCYDQL
jgi:hypothetical protein